MAAYVRLYALVAYFLLASAIFYTWILNHARGSALLAVLFHGAANAASLFYAGVDGALANWLQAGLWVVAALVVVAVCSPSLTRRRASPDRGARVA